MADLQRAHVCLATRGREGASPHFVSDVLGKLRARGYTDVSCRRFKLYPLAFSLTVQGRALQVRLGHPNNCQTPYESWFYVVDETRGQNAFVCANMVRMCSVPYLMDEQGIMFDLTTYMHDAHGVMQWQGKWPSATFDAVTFANALSGKSHKIVACTDVAYLSEEACCDAIATVLERRVETSPESGSGNVVC